MRPLVAVVCASLAFVPLAASAQADLPFDVRLPGNVVQKVAASLGPARKANFVAVVSRETLRPGGRSATPTWS